MWLIASICSVEFGALFVRCIALIQQSILANLLRCPKCRTITECGCGPYSPSCSKPNSFKTPNSWMLKQTHFTNSGTFSSESGNDVPPYPNLIDSARILKETSHKKNNKKSTKGYNLTRNWAANNPRIAEVQVELLRQQLTQSWPYSHEQHWKETLFLETTLGMWTFQATGWTC